MNPRHSAMVLVAAASTIVASAAYLAPQAATAAGARHHAYPHHLTGTAKGFQQVDNAPKGDSMGDVIVDTFALARSGHALGTAIQYCVLAEPDHGLAQCTGTLPLPGGRITMGGEVDGSRVTRMPVLGGTGRYQHASGVAVFTPHGEAISVDLHLSGVR